MARLRTGKIGSSYPGIVDSHLIRFLGEDILPLSVARQVIEISGSHLTEVAATHLHTADILTVVELVPLLLGSIAESLDGLIGIVLAQRVVALQTEGLSGDGTVGGISPSSHRRAACLIHHAPACIRIGHTL